jgi:glucosamine-phosphate N-acetyltransferase
VEIRVCDIDNVNELNEMFNLLKQVWFLDDIDKFKTNIKLFLETQEMEIYIIKNKSQILGTTTLHYQHKLIRNGCKAGLIEEVVVDEKFRGKKIGEKLVKYVTKKAIENGCYKVILSCFPERVKFYERCGYKKESNTMRIDKN